MSETNKNKRCWECEIEGEPLEEHHPVPRSRGGTKTILLCSVCHSKAHHRKKNVSISKLTKEGLARKMATGWKAGNPKLTSISSIGRETMMKRADEFAMKLAPIVRGFQADGVTTLKELATSLTEAGIKTARGGEWRGGTVANILKRLERLN